MGWSDEREQLEQWCDDHGGKLNYIEDYDFPVAVRCEGGDFTETEVEGFDDSQDACGDVVWTVHRGSVVAAEVECSINGGATLHDPSTGEAVVNMSEGIFEATDFWPLDGALRPDPKEVSRRDVEWTPVTRQQEMDELGVPYSRR